MTTDAAIGLFCLLLGSVPAIADESPETDRLIKQLGSSSFMERQAASKRLAALGDAATKALSKAVNENRNAEIRHRAEAILQIIPSAQLKQLAPKLKFFATGEFLKDRFSIYRDLPQSMVEEYQDLIGPLSDRRYPVEALVKLLKHPDAQMRTLALAALFAREEPKLLPKIASLMPDTAMTYSRLSEVPKPTPSFDPKFDPKLLEKQTVGEVAARMVGEYLGRVAFLPENPKPLDFRIYWEARKDRNHCASWFAVQLDRASQGMSPPSPYRTARIRAIRTRIDQLPPVERAWVLLWLLGQPGQEVLITEQEVVAAANDLGPEQLLGLLRRQAVVDDPDWRYPQRQITPGFHHAVHLVLSHAGELLRPRDADTLLSYEAREFESVQHGNGRPVLTGFWAIGAAQLQPARARTILRAAFQRYTANYQSEERVALALALWRSFGPSETRFLVDWFYQEEPELGAGGFGRRAFLEELPGLRPPEDRKLIAALVRDRRFDELDWQSLQRLVKAVNGWTKQPVVTSEAMEKVWHPYGDGHFLPVWLDKAKREYPKETENLLNTLHSWRTAVRQSLPRWETRARQ